MRINADDLLDLLLHLFRIGRRQIDLVEHREDLEIVVESKIDVRQRLCFNPLGCVHYQQSTFTGSQRARDLVGKVNMTGGVDQVKNIVYRRQSDT